ncbi:hypothetical protein [Scleromatobacter humisilvae]|uniref:Uncharacterized protein n=1 Tax=Scleromatobacter humisilvae TaxID=2897159 RepID=A0A9X2BZA2_9BURK|nr:hypothetical protein [Scleromatobacter humisilvae]MCK9686102.1 hypothetical protein [Scleromatobacter humisilvae]
MPLLADRLRIIDRRIADEEVELETRGIPHRCSLRGGICNDCVGAVGWLQENIRARRALGVRHSGDCIRQKAKNPK